MWLMNSRSLEIDKKKQTIKLKQFFFMRNFLLSFVWCFWCFSIFKITKSGKFYAVSNIYNANKELRRKLFWGDGTMR